MVDYAAKGLTQVMQDRRLSLFEGPSISERIALALLLSSAALGYGSPELAAFLLGAESHNNVEDPSLSPRAKQVAEFFRFGFWTAATGLGISSALADASLIGGGVALLSAIGCTAEIDFRTISVPISEPHL